MLNGWIGRRVALSHEELLRARFTVAALLVCCVIFVVEGSVQFHRDQIEGLTLCGISLVAVLGLLGWVRAGGAIGVAAHGVLGVMLCHALIKIVATEGETRAFVYLVFVPLIGVATCGRRHGIGWGLATLACLATASLLPLTGTTAPLQWDLHLRPIESYAVASALVATSLGLATWYDVLRAGFVEDLRSAREAGDAAKMDLADSRERFHALLEHSFDGAAIIDEDGRFQYVRAAGPEPMLGFTRAQLGGRPMHELAEELVHPEDLQRAETALRDLLEVPGKVAHEVLRMQHLDGSWHTIELAAHNLTREPSVLGIVLNYRDLTVCESRNGELLERIGRASPDAAQSLRLFAGGLAHEINNMLTVVLGNAEQLAENLPPESVDLGPVREIETAGWRLSTLTETILVYSGRSMASLRLADLGPLLGRMVPGLRASLPRDIDLAVHRTHRELPVQVDAALLERAVLALVENAAFALPSQGTIVLRVGFREVDQDYLDGCYENGDRFAPGPHAFVSVSDEGRGIAPADLPHVFDPYFSTHVSRRGLGLTLVLGVARAHRAAVRIESVDDVGTNVTLLFPLSTA